MYIDEVKGGTDVNVRASNQEGQSLHFASHVIDSFTKRDMLTIDSAKDKLNGNGYKFIIVEAFRDYDAILNFIYSVNKDTGEKTKSKHIYCEVTMQCDDRPYLFKKIKIIRVNLKDMGPVHMIICATEGEKINRRTEYRLPLHIDAVMRVNDSGWLHNVTLRDISVSGMGVIIQNNCDVDIDDSVHLEFYDSHYDKQKREDVEDLYRLDGHIVRIVDIDEKYRLIGLAVTTKGNKLGKLINKKQIERAKLHNR